jgi:regulator of replication initiation timing
MMKTDFYEDVCEGESDCTWEYFGDCSMCEQEDVEDTEMDTVTAWYEDLKEREAELDEIPLLDYCDELWAVETREHYPVAAESAEEVKIPPGHETMPRGATSAAESAWQADVAALRAELAALRRDFTGLLVENVRLQTEIDHLRVAIQTADGRHQQAQTVFLTPPTDPFLTALSNSESATVQREDGRAICGVILKTVSKRGSVAFMEWNSGRIYRIPTRCRKRTIGMATLVLSDADLSANRDLLDIFTARSLF